MKFKPDMVLMAFVGVLAVYVYVKYRNESQKMAPQNSMALSRYFQSQDDLFK